MIGAFFVRCKAHGVPSKKRLPRKAVTAAKMLHLDINDRSGTKMPRNCLVMPQNKMLHGKPVERLEETRVCDYMATEARS